MQVHSRHRLVLAALLAASACQVPQVTPPSAELRQSFGVVALAETAELTLSPIAPPDVVGAGSGAGAGALAGIVGSLGAGGQLEHGSQPHGLGLLLGIALAPVAGVVGAVVGAAMAPSEEEVATAQARLGPVWSQATPGASLTRAFLERSQKAGWSISEAGDEASPQLVSGAAEIDPADAPDTRLQIGVEALELVFEGDFDPDVHILLRTYARFSRAADNAELFQAKWAVLRKGQPYFSYAERPQALQGKIDKAVSIAADAMATFLFAASAPIDAQQTTAGGTMVIEAKAGVAPPPAAAVSGAADGAGDQGAHQAPAVVSPRPDGTIVLSPDIAARLQKYLDSHPAGPSFFYASLDGLSGGEYIAGRSWRSDLQAFDMTTASMRAKERARSACGAGAATECVMLFHQSSAKQPYATL